MQIVDRVGTNVFALVYGASGSGKTHLIGTLGDLGRVLVIDVDKGGVTLLSPKAHFQQSCKTAAKNITIVSFDKFTDLNEAHKLISKNDPSEWSKVLGIPITEPFDWFVWDTWSELQWNMLQELRQKENATSPGMFKNTLDFRKNIQIQHWGAMTDLNKLCIESFRDLNKNMVIVMQEVLDKDELTGEVFGGPAIHGKMVREMPAFFNLVIRTKNSTDGSSVATTKAQGRWPAKTRYGIGSEFKNPTMKEILGL